MIYVYNLLIVAHFLGWVMVLGGWLVSLKSHSLSSGVFHGAATALISGAFAFVLTLPKDGVDIDLSAPKMIIKIVLTAVITVLAWIATHGTAEKDPPRWAGMAMGALTLATMILAVFWR